MSEARFEKIEKRIKKLETDREYMINHINELHIMIEKIKQTQTTQSIPDQQPIPMQGTKVEYLTVANEQMFNQIQRLRQYIEECLDGKKQLDEKGYLRALSGEE